MVINPLRTEIDMPIRGFPLRDVMVGPWPISWNLATAGGLFCELSQGAADESGGIIGCF